MPFLSTIDNEILITRDFVGATRARFSVFSFNIVDLKILGLFEFGHIVGAS
jgi:hypothetical protein